jgi:ATP-dependent helicase/nuclease subunit A
VEPAHDKRDLTEEQRRAIHTRDVSVALSAGAGCGKTFTLVERFLSHRALLSSLIAITFTERAAREMRERIEQACRERLLAAADDESERFWLGRLRELEAARVSTIHSFCASMLRSHAVEAGLDPRFQVLEDAQSATLLSEIIDDELRRQLVDASTPARRLAAMFGLESLHAMIAKLLASRHEIDFDFWIAAGPDDLVERWRRFHAENILRSALAQIAASSAARTVLELARTCHVTHPEMQRRCALLVELLPALTASSAPDESLKEIREAAKVQKGGTKANWPSEADYGRFRDSAEELRKAIDAAWKTVAFDASLARESAVAGLQLLQIVKPVAEAYRRKKTELGVLDFDDLLRRTRDLLEHPRHAELRRRLSENIELLLVDEFQDTDPLQVGLVQALSGPANTGRKLFFVGDLKQSIYRFRGAAPNVFRDLRQSVPSAGQLALTLNFRSQPAILDFVNALFCEDLGPDYEALRPNRPQVTPQPAIEFLWAPPPAFDQGAADTEAERSRKETVEDLRNREAKWIARRLRSMFDGGEAIVLDKDSAGRAAARTARPGDVAILFRALSDVEIYENALRTHDIPYYVVGGKAFYSQQEVFDLLNVLRTIADPTNEVALVGALRSPFFSLPDETLFWLAERGDRRSAGGGLAAGLFAKTLPAELDKAQRRRAAFAANTLRELRERKDRLAIAELINEVLARTGYDAILLAEFLGDRKLANLHKLIEQARGFDRAGIFSLADFLAQLSQFVADQPDEALAATHRETSDVVRLMSIHKSKGLEFPVVIVPDLERRGGASTTSVAFDPRLGPLVAARDGDGEVLAGGLALYKFIENEEDAAEATRLFYVATTRAADYLILSSGVRHVGQPEGAWRELLARRFDLESGELAAELPDGLGVPRIRVTVDEPTLAEPASSSKRRASLSQIVERAEQLAVAGTGGSAPSVAPIAPDATARRMFSFSRLSGVLRAGEAEPHPIDELAPPAPTAQADALELGTLVHAVLAQLDFTSPGEIEPLLRRCAAAGGNRREMEQAIGDAVVMLTRFVKSPRAAELAAARELHAELEFLLAWPPEDVPDGREAPPCILEGVIDCLYQDPSGRWHILDYKTNRVTEAGVAKAAGPYEMQMLLYGLAVERILHEPPASLVLHFLRPGVEHGFEWNDAARRRAIELVDRGLAAVGMATMA